MLFCCLVIVAYKYQHCLYDKMPKIMVITVSTKTYQSGFLEKPYIKHAVSFYWNPIVVLVCLSLLDKSPICYKVLQEIDFFSSFCQNTQTSFGDVVQPGLTHCPVKAETAGSNPVVPVSSLQQYLFVDKFKKILIYQYEIAKCVKMRVVVWHITGVASKTLVFSQFC